MVLGARRSVSTAVAGVHDEKATLAHPGDPPGSPGRRKGTRVSVENTDATPAAEGAATTRVGRTRRASLSVTVC